MKFDYKSYLELLEQLKTYNYEFCDYHNYQKYPHCVILRHDIDQSVEHAVQMAELEAKAGARSTYFVLMTSDFYNAASATSLKGLRSIQKLGHEIGLHFDEAAYGEISQEECIRKILAERNILSALLGSKVTTVSMHRPSQATLKGNLQIPGMINSYSYEFFHDFKYLSDSRRRWREPVEEIVKAGTHNRLHILTHAFWYGKVEKSMADTIRDFVIDAMDDRYQQMSENITDLASVVRREDI